MPPRIPWMASTCSTAQTACTSMEVHAGTTGCGTPVCSTTVSPEAFPAFLPCNGEDHQLRPYGLSLQGLVNV
eukprot:1157718-Pelagomonas_calceolata.AAC.10